MVAFKDTCSKVVRLVRVRVRISSLMEKAVAAPQSTMSTSPSPTPMLLNA